MADLRSRLGPRISANKSWIRPGYDIHKKSPFTKPATQDDAKEELGILGASWQSEFTLAGHSIENGDKALWHPDAPGKNAISLLQRVEMQTQDHEDADNLEDKHVEKSLFDRIGSAPEKSANGVLSGFGSSCGGLANDINGERDHRHVGNPSSMVIYQAESDVKDGPRQSATGHRTGPAVEAHVIESRNAKFTDTSRGTSRESFKIPLSRPDTAPIPSQSDRDRTTDQTTHRLSETSHILSTTSEQKFRGLVLPLTQKIALCRAKESTCTIPAHVNSSAITHQALVELAKQLVKLRKDLRDHGAVPIINGKRPEHISANGTGAAMPVYPSHDSRQIKPALSWNEQSESQARERKRISHFDSRIPSPKFYDKKYTRRSPDSSSYSLRKTSGRCLYSEPRYPSRRTPSPMHRRRSGDVEHDRNCHRGKNLDLGEHRHSSKGNKALRRSTSPRQRGSHHQRSEGCRRRSRSPVFHRRSSLTTLRRSRSPVSSQKRRDRSRSYSPRRAERGRQPRLIKQPHRDYEIHRRHVDSVIGTSRKLTMQVSDVDLSEHENQRTSAVALPVQTGELQLPCRGVPGVWFALQGLHELGTSKIEFEVDEETATKWKISTDRPKLDSGLLIETKSLDSDSGQMRLSLELCCLDVSDVQTTLRNLGKDVPSYDVVQAFSKLKKAWPPKGHLIISVNAENEELVAKVSIRAQPDSSLQIEQYIRKGKNTVEFIQLSDLSERVFVLLATGFTTRTENNLSNSNFLSPQENTEIQLCDAVLTISKA